MAEYLVHRFKLYFGFSFLPGDNRKQWKLLHFISNHAMQEMCYVIAFHLLTCQTYWGFFRLSRF